MSAYRFVELSREGAVAIVTLSDPGTLNAASLTMVDELLDALGRCASDGARALVMTGKGQGFCSGAKLSDAMNVDDPGYDAGKLLESHYNPLMLALRDLPMPFVTAVNGIAAGIGCGMALAGDLIVASETASFLQPFRRIGLAPDSGTAFLLTRAIGRVRAMELLLLGDRLPAATALAWGLVSRVVPADQLMAEAMRLAQDLAAGPTIALKAARDQCWAAPGARFDEMLELERRHQYQAGRTADHREGLRAFLQKRPPRFTGA